MLGWSFNAQTSAIIGSRECSFFGYNIHNPGKIDKATGDQIVEEALRKVLLWDQIKDRLGVTATSLSLEEQQRLCIARLLPVKPSVLLMDMSHVLSFGPKGDRGGRRTHLGASRRLHHSCRDAQHGSGKTG